MKILFGKNGIIRRLTALILTCMLLVPAMPVSTYAAGGGVYAKLVSLKNKYPEGYFWNHLVTTTTNDGDSLLRRRDESFANSVTSRPCATHHGAAKPGQYDCNYFDGGLQCMGFAKKVFYDVFGVRESSLPKRYDTGNLMVGDYVRINGNTHSGVVLSISGNNFRLCECNFDKDGAHHNCLIRWGYVNYNKSCISYFKRASNYSAVDTVNLTMSWNNPRGSIGERNATIYVTAQANASGRFTAASGTLYDASGRYLASKSENAGVNGSKMDIWYNIATELKKNLQPGTYYYLRFTCTFSGKTFTSPYYRFKTAGKKEVAVQRVTLSRTSAVLFRGRSLKLKAGVYPANATYKSVTWTSSNKKIATVSASGTVKAKGRGSCLITARTSNGKKATCRIYVW